MNEQEQQLIGDLFHNLRQQAAAPKDLQAEAAIRQQAAQVPDALYLLTQRALLLEQALQQAQQQLAQLQNQPPRSGFLPSNPDLQFGRGNSTSFTPSANPPGAAAPSHWRERWFGAAPATSAAAPAAAPAAPSAGSSFLGNAAASAAGVAGGMLLFNGLSNLWGQHQPNANSGNNWDAASNGNGASQHAANNNGAGLDQLAHDAGRDNVDQSLQPNPLMDDSFSNNDDDGGFFGAGSDDDFA